MKKNLNFKEHENRLYIVGNGQNIDIQQRKRWAISKVQRKY